MAKISTKKLTRHFWNEESGLTSMLILLLISNFLVMPFFSERPVVTLLMRAFWFFLLMTGITTLSKDKSQARYLLIIPILLIIGSVLGYFIDNPVLYYADFLVILAVLSLLTGLVFIKVFESGPVTIHRVIGAIVAYMLIGNIWAFIYHFIYLQVPGSFQIPGLTEYVYATPVTFLYFSYTTLTTAGYGDILPLNTLTRTLANIEQLVGVLFPAVLIGRLVSLITDKSK